MALAKSTYLIISLNSFGAISLHQINRISESTCPYSKRQQPLVTVCQRDAAVNRS
ncbi:hypothetical protein [Pedobacter sp. SL55]|uniref:hypothetical protein n=1 Tax=Pedobacter sp. SL55 TaxID=2995161 RepID=UPI0022710FE6|nr:hypothetical protein [Pedobacter sp. SL55]WAC40073.1 hypothetical protein OVA16_16020 [Pedobacter sp. SL55]